MTLQFDKNGRVKYNKLYHRNQGKPYTTSEQKYLIEYYEFLGPQTLSLELERTESSISAKVAKLRKAGLMPPKPENKRYHKRELNNAPL